MHTQLNFFIFYYIIYGCVHNVLFNVSRETLNKIYCNILLIFTSGLHSILLTQPISLYFNLQTFKQYITYMYHQ